MDARFLMLDTTPSFTARLVLTAVTIGWDWSLEPLPSDDGGSLQWTFNVYDVHKTEVRLLAQMFAVELRKL